MSLDIGNIFCRRKINIHYQRCATLPTGFPYLMIQNNRRCEINHKRTLWMIKFLDLIFESEYG